MQDMVVPRQAGPQFVVTSLRVMQAAMVVPAVVQHVAGVVEGVLLGMQVAMLMQVVQVRGVMALLHVVQPHVGDGQLRVVQIVGIVLLCIMVVMMVVMMVLFVLLGFRAHVQHAGVRGHAAIQGVVMDGAVCLQHLLTGSKPSADGVEMHHLGCLSLHAWSGSSQHAALGW